MRYYLETNALYSIDAIINVCNNRCFTSVLSLLELISGINIENFNKRKNILNKVAISNIAIDWEMPEKIIFDSFGVTNDYKYKEERTEAIKELIEEIFFADSFKDFFNSKQYNSTDYGFEYFKNLDFSWSKSFVAATIIGNKKIKKELQDNDKGVILDGKVYKIKEPGDLVNLFDYEPRLSHSCSIYAFCGMIKSQGIDKSEDEIYDSYNGLIYNYILGLSEYCDQKMIMYAEPAINDFQDLMHLIYLRNFNDLTIVSNDKIFGKYFKGNSISIERLLEIYS